MLYCYISLLTPTNYALNVRDFSFLFYSSCLKLKMVKTKSSSATNRLEFFKWNLKRTPNENSDIVLTPELEKYCKKIQSLGKTTSSADVLSATNSMLNHIRAKPGLFSAAELILLQNLQSELQSAINSPATNINKNIDRLDVAAKVITSYIEANPGKFTDTTYSIMLDLEAKVSQPS